MSRSFLNPSLAPAADVGSPEAEGHFRQLQQHPLLRCLLLYRHMPWRFAITAFLFIAVNITLAWQQWLVGQAIHDAERGAMVVTLADQTVDYMLAWHWLQVLVGVALLRGVLQYGAGLIALIIGQQLLSILREMILIHVQRLDLSYHWRHGIGELVTRTTRDADKVRDALISFWRQVFETALVVMAAVGLLWWYDIRLAIVPLLLTLIGVAIFVRQTSQLVVLDRAVGSAYDNVTQDLTEGIHGVRVIKAFALEASRIKRFAAQVETFSAHARAALAFSSVRIPLPQAVVALGHAWILGFGAYLVSRGELNLGELVASLLIATTLVFRIEGVGRVMQVFADARSSAARIWELLDERPTILSGTNALPEGPLAVRFDHVTVNSADRDNGTGGGKPVLQDCSFEIAAGEVVALVGTTGSGKSTLASLLPRLLDVSYGAVEIGNETAGWHDVCSIKLAELRRAIHVVPQETFLFFDTLAANLRFAAPNATDADMIDVLKQVSATEILEKLPDGFNTKLGDRGVTLSGGQRQRISLARALLSQPRILVLDDSTSALDAVTERTILDNIRARKQSHDQHTTLLLIASKLSTILLADRVLMLADGKIAASGTHAQLAADNAAYRDLLGLDHG